MRHALGGERHVTGGKPGLELVKDLEKAHPNLPVLVLSIHDETLWAEPVLRAGAEGYIMKSQATQKVVDAVRQVLGGGIWISDKMNATSLSTSAFSGTRPVVMRMPLVT